MNRPFSIACIGLSGIVLGFLSGWFFHTPPGTGPFSLRQSDVASSTLYRFIDPLLAIRNPDQNNSPEYDSLFEDIRTVITSAQQDNKIKSASVFFRDMGPSKGFIINGDEQYSPASLLKVPTMMSYLKISETKPAVLSGEAAYSGARDSNTQEYFKSPTQLTPGTYSVTTLIKHMILYSDNNAAEALIDYLNNTGNSGGLVQLFYDLGVSKIDLSSDFITIRAYALFFRVLYNATYLNRENSEEALSLLSQTDFTDGLRAGITDKIDIGHKFGEFTLKKPGGAVIKRELHDCGIVYYPKHPYLLCVMTKGDDFNNLKAVIAGISRHAYSFMAARYPTVY